MRLSVVPLLSLVVGACFLSSEPAEQLDLSISLSSTRMRPDSPVTVRVTATNRTTRSLRLETMGGCVVGFSVTGPGEEPTSPGIGCPSILEVIVVLPGDSVVSSYTLSAGASWDHEQRTIVRPPTGTYTVVGYLLDSDMRVVKRTEPVTFELVCSDPSWTEC